MVYLKIEKYFTALIILKKHIKKIIFKNIPPTYVFVGIDGAVRV
jgi:hypothetical protein